MRDTLKTILIAAIVVFISIPAQMTIASLGSLHTRLVPGESAGAVAVGIGIYAVITYALSHAFTRLASKDREAKNVTEVFLYALITTGMILCLRFVINLFLFL
jgi:uncharacterized membrane protein